MAKLTVGFSYAPTKWFSKLIKWVTKSQVSHAFVVLEIAGQTMIYQASGLCVNYHSKDVFLGIEKTVEFYEFNVTDEKAAANQLFRLTTVGKPYSWQEIVGYAVVLGYRMLGLTTSNPFSGGKNAYICVDIAAAHIPTDPELEDGDMTPEDLRRWCSQHGTKIDVKSLS